MNYEEAAIQHVIDSEGNGLNDKGALVLSEGRAASATRNSFALAVIENLADDLLTEIRVEAITHFEGCTADLFNECPSALASLRMAMVDAVLFEVEKHADEIERAFARHSSSVARSRQIDQQIAAARENAA